MAKIKQTYEQDRSGVDFPIPSVGAGANLGGVMTQAAPPMPVPAEKQSPPRSAAAVMAQRDIESERENTQRQEFERDYQSANELLAQRRRERMESIPVPRETMGLSEWTRKYHPKLSRMKYVNKFALEQLQTQYGQYRDSVVRLNKQEASNSQRRGGGAGGPKSFEQFAMALWADGQNDHPIVKAWKKTKGITPSAEKKLKKLMATLKAKAVSGELNDIAPGDNEALMELLYKSGDMKRPPAAKDGKKSDPLFSSRDMGEWLYGRESDRALVIGGGVMQQMRDSIEQGDPANRVTTWLGSWQRFNERLPGMDDNTAGQIAEILGSTVPFDGDPEAVKAAYQRKEISKEDAVGLIRALGQISQYDK